jgi:hypothetical protein
VTYNGAGL